VAFAETTWYCNAGDQSTTGYYAVAKFAASTAYSAGQLVRQLTAPAVGSERVFVVIVAGTSSTEPSWTVTRGAKNTSGGVTFQECTGAASLNGDATNTPNWTAQKAAGNPTLGAIIKRNNGASYQICSTAGTLGASEPAFSDTAGTTTTEGTTTWTSLGPVSGFTGGQAPHARLANACASTWFAAGNTVYVGDNHAESQTTTINIAPAAATNLVNRILCHNHSGSYPPASTDLMTGASISTTAAANINFSPSPGLTYVYGLAFLVGVGGSNNAFINLSPINAFYRFDNCLFKLATTFTNPQISLGSNNSGAVLWNNCSVYFGNIAQYIDVESTNFVWQNTGQVLASGSLVPSTAGLLNNAAAARLSSVVLEALDLSQLTGPIFSTGALAHFGNWVVKDCKLNASASFPTPFFSGLTSQLVRCDSSGTAYKSARYTYEGTETTETSITRVGGASDPTGQAQSRKIVTTANSQWLRPFKAEPYAIWNPTTGANVTVTVYGTINAGALPFNDDIWLEVEYLGASGSPLGTIVTTTKASVLAANAAVASDGSTWNGTSPSYTTWNPADQGPQTVLSGGNLTATTSGVMASVRSIGSQSSGKFYFETTWTGATFNLATNAGPSVANSSATPGSSGFAGDTGSVGPVLNNGAIWNNNANSGINIGAVSAGNVICCAVDLDAKLIWFRLNNGNWNGSGTANPATGTGGVSISWLSSAAFVRASTQSASTTCTANFGASTFAFSVPSGFTSGWPLGGGSWAPFKLVAVLSAPQPGLAGYIHARVRAAKPSSTFYVDPQITLG